MRSLRVTIGVAIAAMAVLTYISFNTDMDMGTITHPRPSHQPVSTQCSTAAKHGLRLCGSAPAVPEFDLPDTPENEGTYCGNHDGPCTVNAYINGEWVIVRLVR